MTQNEWQAPNITAVMQKVAQGWHLVQGPRDIRIQQWAWDNTVGDFIVWHKLYAFEFDADAALFKMATGAQDASLVARVALGAHVKWIQENCTEYEWHDIVQFLDGKSHYSKVEFNHPEDLARYHLRWSQ